MHRVLNVRPKAGGRFLLGFLPLLALVLFYLAASTAKHAENPREKSCPPSAPWSSRYRSWLSRSIPRPAPYRFGRTRARASDDFALALRSRRL